MKRRILLSGISTLSFVVLMTLSAHGQAKSSIGGTVTDAKGEVVAGARIVVEDVTTGLEFRATSSSMGAYTVPALGAGTYTVTVEARGFKKALVQDVKVDVGVPATVNVTLEVGAATDSVVIQGGAEILQSQSANISTTLSTPQLSQLPLQSRNTIYLLTTLPGVSSPATSSPRNSVINGLPSSAYNITIDGLNTQDNLNKNGDGFFSYINPTVDAVQEVTISSATPGAESSGQGAIQIKFATRSGSNELHGSLYYYHRNTALNANYWFTNRDVAPVNNATGLACTAATYNPEACHAPKAKALFHQFGGRVGGPITIPKLFNGKDRAFFFVNMEEFRQPNAVSRTRTILHPSTQAGLFQYTVGGTTRTVNLLTLTAPGVPAATIDPTVGKLLAEIRSSTANTGGITQNVDPNLQTFTFANSSMGIRYFPTVRLDFNLSSKHRLENTYNYQSYNTTVDTLNSVDPAFPGFPNFGSQISNRFTEGLTLRSTLSPTVVNEARFGFTGGTVLFFPGVNPGQFVNQGGWSLGISQAGISNATVNNGPERRNAPVWDFANSVSWTRGAHSFSFGGQFTQVNLWITDYDNVVPSIGFSVATGDPALALFNTTNFPNASTTNLTAAQNIYAVLTGRVSSIGAIAALDEATSKYIYNGAYQRRARQRELGFYAQDSWRARPNLTLTGGLRYEVQLPFTTLNGVYSKTDLAGLWGVSGIGNLFKPGTLTGKKTEFTQFKEGEKAYNADYKNFAPSLGFAWSLSAGEGWLKRIIGDNGQTVIRGGYSIAYNRQGSASFLSIFDFNPGVRITATRSTALGNLVTGTGGDTLPVLLSQANRLGPPAFPSAPVYPLTGAITDSPNIFEEDLRVPYTQSWTIGVQREITKDMALEVRYVHNVNLQQWLQYNLNEVNIVENGFLNEFKLAQANLQANIAAGRGSNFRYFGPGTGTAPLPIYLAYFSGIPAAQAGVVANYSSANFASATFINPLALRNPAPYTTAGTGTAGFQGNAALRQNALNAGLPSNFFVVNPDHAIGGAWINSNGGYSRYDGLQVDLRRRMSKGLFLNANYTFSKAFVGTRFSHRQGWVNALNGNNLKHAIKVNWIYDLPFGKGQKFMNSPSGWAGGLLDKVVGGWQWDGNARFQPGASFNLGSGFKLVGMTQKDVQKAYKIRKDDANKRVYIFPQDIIDQTILAFSTSATAASGYSGAAPTGRYFAPSNDQTCIAVVTGDCSGQTFFIQGPWFSTFDMSAVKKFRLTEKWDLEFRAEFLNAFNTINFLGNTNLTPSSSQSFGQVTSAYRDVNNTQNPGGRLIQFVMRLNF